MTRRVKINDRVIKAFEGVLDDMDNTYLTEEEICILVNDELDKKDRFGYCAFKEWKAAAVGSMMDADTSEYNKIQYRKIANVIKRALVKTKKILLSEVRKGENNWQSKSWILERKFDEWNLRRKEEKTQVIFDLSGALDNLLKDGNRQETTVEVVETRTPVLDNKQSEAEDSVQTKSSTTPFLPESLQ